MALRLEALSSPRPHPENAFSRISTREYLSSKEGDGGVVKKVTVVLVYTGRPPEGREGVRRSRGRVMGAGGTERVVSSKQPGEGVDSNASGFGIDGVFLPSCSNRYEKLSSFFGLDFRLKMWD